MTREDKIEQLENLKCHCYDMARVENSSNEWMKDIEALDFAIATLKQQPSEDCISRQAVIEYIKDCNAELMHDIENEAVREDILDMPPVTPKIPTSDDCVSRKQAIATIGTDIQLNLEGKSGLLKYSDEIKDILKALLDSQEKKLKALPPVTLKQEPKTDVLDKIKAEIEQKYIDDGAMQEHTVDRCLDIIDKYKAESKEK